MGAHDLDPLTLEPIEVHWLAIDVENCFSFCLYHLIPSLVGGCGALGLPNCGHRVSSLHQVRLWSTRAARSGGSGGGGARANCRRHLGLWRHDDGCWVWDVSEF